MCRRRSVSGHAHKFRLTTCRSRFFFGSFHVVLAELSLNTLTYSILHISVARDKKKKENWLPDTQSNNALLLDMQNEAIYWRTLWFLTNLLVDTPYNKILISGF
jgi:hypothetical protein